MGLFKELLTVDETKLQALYHRVWHEAGMKFVDPRKFPYLDHAIHAFAVQNDCSYDDAWILAKTGKRTGRLAR